jgi:hypothetical protein
MMLSGSSKAAEFKPRTFCKLGALAQARSTFRSLPAEQTTGIDWRKADGKKDHPVCECAD